MSITLNEVCDFMPDIIAMLDDSEGKHLCAHCTHMKDLGSGGLLGTTVDVNSCPMVFKDLYGDNAIYCLTGESGNDRRYANGLTMEDNGGGYWITRCPYYIQVDPMRFYYAYMASVEWNRKRIAQIKEDRFVCQMCGTAKNLQVHHVTYEHIGFEKPGDLVTLCKWCHRKVHKRDLQEADE